MIALRFENPILTLSDASPLSWENLPKDDLMFWGGVLCVGISILFLILYWVRQSLRKKDSGAGVSVFSRKQMEQWHQEGKLTDEEYEQVKSKMAQRAKAQYLDQKGSEIFREEISPESKESSED